MKNPSTKLKIMEAAIELFNTNGYNGTSVREIAKQANVNVAHISYYFNGKKGLSEHLISHYYEGYLKSIEMIIETYTSENVKEKLLNVIFAILYYDFQNRQLARFVQREITFDNLLVREVMTTYLKKEQYYLSMIIQEGVKNDLFKKINIPYFIIQLKGLLSFPFVQPQYIVEVLHTLPHEPYFVEKYYEGVKGYIEIHLFRTESLTI
ncbi:forespore capture DNA-binding protein RefZ [Bacillus carboniphilus]|uniref:Forespore capture DNA-binding protein RefZ n=1 Tax=Bacillus carboniphilus TaxID=86663 RepID=A0ABY9JXT3_9BACI|nr:forespore capture DNA-binding protein RefZ [Bacillus carboniphilus]WLR44194.1 forespore capture DNA-binding protein RefZ [Bacillus carboniphilus]